MSKMVFGLPIRKIALALAFAVALPGLAAAEPRFAAIFLKDAGADWVARHGMTAKAYQAEFDAQVAKGLRLVGVSGYESDGQTNFAALWERRSGPAWIARHGLTGAQYQQQFDALTAKGYRLVFVNGYPENGVAHYAAIFEKSAGPAWEARHGLTAAEYQTTFDALLAKGYALKLVSGYTVAGDTRYAAIFEKGGVDAWVAKHGMTADAYQAEFDAESASGFRLRYVNGYRIGGQPAFAAIWDATPSAPWIARHNLTSAEYQKEFDSLVAQGYRPIDVSGY
jgi:hypothetical protein